MSACCLYTCYGLALCSVLDTVLKVKPTSLFAPFHRLGDHAKASETWIFWRDDMCVFSWGFIQTINMWGGRAGAKKGNVPITSANPRSLLQSHLKDKISASKGRLVNVRISVSVLIKTRMKNWIEVCQSQSVLKTSHVDTQLNWRLQERSHSAAEHRTCMRRRRADALHSALTLHVPQQSSSWVSVSLSLSL